MFFNYDILYRDGPMAIVWMAGNDELTSKSIVPGKGRKGKLFVKLLSSDLSNLCDQVKKYFPQMGSPNGLGMKKLATLVKGLGFIYLTKIDCLLKSLNEINMKMQITTKQRKNIDLPKASRAKNVAALDLPVAGDGCGDFGILMDIEDGQFLFDMPMNPRMREPDAPELSYLERVVASPSRNSVTSGDRQRLLRKRRRAVTDDEDEEGCNEEDVMTKLRSALEGISTTANCLREHDIAPAVLPGENGFGDIDYMFTDNMNVEGISDFLEINPGNAVLPYANLQSPVPNSPRPRARSPVIEVNETGEAGVELERVVGGRRRLNEMNLEEIEVETQRPRGPRRKRRSRRLIIDEEIIISSEELQQTLREDRRPNDYSKLLQLAAKTRGVICKSPSWKMNGEDLLKSFASNRMGTQLTSWMTRNVRQIKMKDICQPQIIVEPPEVEVERHIQASTMGDQTSRPLGGDGTTLGIGGSIQTSNVELGNRALEGSEEQYPTEAFLQDVDPMVHHGAEFPEGGIPAFPDNVGHQDEEEEIKLQEGETLFRNMYPPATTSRKKAASAFFQLLRLQKSGTVQLKQETAFGDIIVKKRPA